MSRFSSNTGKFTALIMLGLLLVFGIVISHSWLHVKQSFVRSFSATTSSNIEIKSRDNNSSLMDDIKAKVDTIKSSSKQGTEIIFIKSPSKQNITVNTSESSSVQGIQINTNKNSSKQNITVNASESSSVQGIQINTNKNSSKQNITVNASRNSSVLGIQVNTNKSSSKQMGRIHYYNPPPWVGRDTFKNCPQKCFVSFGRNYEQYSTSQFVVFDGSVSLPKEPPPKPAGQVWIYHSIEPPFLQPRLVKWNRKVNWTFSYRRDADFTHVYGTMLLKKVKDTERVKLHSHWKDKTLGNAWFVSHQNVPSRRAEFARKLNKSINVDIYSRKGPKRCPTSVIKTCSQLLGDRYKFYLSFENQLCRDYVTEKCFKIYASQADVIPVVRGVPDYSIFVPPHSFIDTTKFNNISSLGAFQKDLANNQTEFENYFQWRKFYYNEPTGDRAVCKLCARAHMIAKYHRLYENLDLWVRGDQNNPMCRKITDIK